MRKQSLVRWLAAASFAAAPIVACSAGGGENVFPASGGGGTGTGATGNSGGGGGVIIGTGGSGDTGGGGGGGFVTNPTTCEQSEQSRSYIGCDYWPTVTANNVWSIFDFAVVVANTGSDPSDVTVTGPNGVNIQETVPVNELKTIYLPWVPVLKGKDCDVCGSAVPIETTVRQDGGAYHLVASRPVTVYQFSALEYKGQGGPAGKSWAGCPGDKICAMYGQAVGCFSFSNDASLLLPSTAMTGNYRVAGANGMSWSGQPSMPSYVAITGTRDGTNVEFKATGKVVAGGGIGAMSAGQSASFSLNAGDVIEVVGGKADTDTLSGSLISANNPIQVITGVPCRNFPNNASACDHIEESVFPAETLGKEYVVSVPAGPKGGKAPGQAVHIVGNIDGTTLTFDPPINASGVNNGTATINAGQVMMLGIQKDDFHVVGDHEFIVLTFMQGGSVVDPNTQPPDQKGDPSQSLATAVEQYRDMYVFLAPQDYDVNFVNIMATNGTSATLDGQEVASSQFSPVGSSGLMVARVQLAPTGTHNLKSNKPVGIQVYGYGSYTSYQYPGGLNLKSIAPPPPK